MLREARWSCGIGGDRIYPTEIERLGDTGRRHWQMKVRFKGGFALATEDLTIELGPDQRLRRRGRAVHQGRVEALEPDLGAHPVRAVAVGGGRERGGGVGCDGGLPGDAEPRPGAPGDGGLRDLGRHGDGGQGLHGRGGDADLRPGRRRR